MNELKKPNRPHNRYVKIGIWIVLSALILAGLAIIVGVAFEEFGGERASIEEIVYMPQQHDYSRGTSTLSYSMAARYSDGSIGSLPDVNRNELFLGTTDTINTDTDGMDKEDRTRKTEEGAEFNFSYTGSAQSWEVPDNGIYKLEVWGARGGYCYANYGKGGKAWGELELTKGETLKIYVGGSPGNSRNGGFNGGGNNRTGSGGGGGGGTDIRRNGDAMANRIIVGGGGGGTACSSNSHGGDGGGNEGKHGYRFGNYNDHYAGGGGTQNGGGRAGGCCGAQPGQLGRGGDTATGDDCGAGGGGYYGGGGGSNDSGGGGGSSYYANLDNGGTQAGDNDGHGKVKITFVQGGGGSAVYDYKYKDGTGISKDFTYTGGQQSWVVPGGTKFIDVDAFGGEGGSGGKGGQIKARLTVTPGETLYIYVGGKGANQHGNRSGGWNGGGQGGSSNGGRYGAGGGGGTDIRRGGTGWANRILVAGGGGGYYGGGGGGAGITTCCGDSSRNGNSGSQGTGGKGGDAQDGCASGYNNNGGDGGKGGGTTGGNGGRYRGSGNPGNGGTQNGGGSGGSKAGQCDADQISGGGGGGGSSYAKSGSKNIKHTQGVHSGNGKIKISTPPEILGVYYQEPFSDEFKDSEFGPAWSPYSSDDENARNERIDTEPGKKEKAKFTFTNCTQTGRNGPSQGQVNTAYGNSNLNGKVTVSNGVQSWVVPETGKYTIEVQGAVGGKSRYGSANPGKGAKMSGEFNLTKGETIYVVVGQKGLQCQSWANSANGAGGGGGGTFVYKANKTLLIAAGGGGGAGHVNARNPYYHGMDAVTGTTGTESRGRNPGGSNGNNGSGTSGGRGWNTVKNNPIGEPCRGWGEFQAHGGFGGGGGNYYHDGGGGGYSGGGGNRGGGSPTSYPAGGGGASYNNGANKDDKAGVNTEDGKAMFIQYEVINDPGFDAYDEEEQGTTCWVMDTAGARGANLNQLLLHIGLDAGEGSVTSLKLSFAAEVYGTTEVMPASFGVNMLPHNYDGVAVSIDNENWYKVWSPNSAAEWALIENKNLLSILPNSSVDAKEDLYIRFQQYGSGKIKTEGILWDEIYLESNADVEYIFEVPQLNIGFETAPDPFTIYAETQGDPDSATVKVKLSGSIGFDWEGGARGPRAEPIVYNFSNAGASGRSGPTQGQVNSAYSNTNLKDLVTIRTRGIQEWKIPKKGEYTFTVKGAESGTDRYGANYTGKGASMQGTFELEADQVIKILVGQKGDNTGFCCGSAGGGGSFVTKSDNSPLIIAGGGGGARMDSGGTNRSFQDGTTGKNGRNAYYRGENGGTGGTNGNGGRWNRSGCGGGPGGGLSGDGENGGGCRGSGGKAFKNGGEGGVSSYCGGTSGFGGGGGVGCGGAGGGGGYGGGGSVDWGSAGGGGSYNDGTEQSNQAGANSGNGSVTVTYIGGGDPIAEEVRFTYEKAEGLVIDGDADIEEVTWSSADENEEDALLDGDEFEIEFDLSSPDGFYDSIGPATVSYFSWDGDEIEYVLPIPNLRIQAFSYAKLEGEVIANNGAEQNDPGSLLAMESYDDQDPPGVMPGQVFTNWRAKDLGDSVEFIDAIDNATGQPFTHKKIIRVTGGKPGDTGTVYTTHKASGEEDGYPVTLVSGPVAQGSIYQQETYVVGETGVISVALEDDYGNACVDWKDRMYVKVTAGKVEFEDKLENDATGDYYMYTAKDKGVHDFIITPLTFHAIGPTVIEFKTVSVPIGEPASLKVVAGPVKSLHVDYDPANMPGWDGSYYAGEELYFTIYGTDKMGNPSSTYDAPIIVTHDFKTENKELVPDPWQSSDGAVILNMVDGVAANYPDTPIKFYGAGEVSLTFRSKVNLEGINGYTKKITVNPTYLDHLEAMPGGPDAAPVTVDVKVGETQFFSVKGFDEFDNPIEIDSTTWRVDADIKAKETPDVLNNGEFKAIEYFGPNDEGVVFDVDLGLSTRKGNVEVTAVCPRDQREIKRDISVRVLNDKDVWLDASDIEPEHILAGHEMNFKANIYYDMPVTDPGTKDQASALGDLFEVTVIVSLVDKDGKNPFELVREPIRFEDLNTNPDGIESFNVKVPWESFSDNIKVWEDGNDDTKNYLLVEVDEVIGGTDMKLFEKTNDNNRVTVELYTVGAPAASQTPSFAPSVAAMGIALLGLAVGSTFYSGKRRKKGYRGDREAVSPVIAIILMVAITIVLAGVLWLWVSGLVDTGKEDGVGGIVNVEPDTRTVNKDYVLKVETLTAENDLSVEDLRFTLFSSDRRDMSNGQHRVSNVYGKPIDDQTFISFRDGDHDGKLSIGDRFVIKSFEHVDDDGSTDSPGFAEPGFFFELRAGKRLLFEEQIK